MPPKRAKKNASSASDDAIPSFPAPPTTHTVPPEETHTPEQSPQKQAIEITQAQKQALIDNLQLEITERARKLRAQYALQAQALRSRLEMRVNRIPTALRKRKIQDLLDEHTEKAEPKPAPAVPVKETAQRAESPERPRKAIKRTSETTAPNFAHEDKENVAPSHPQPQDLPINKKRPAAATKPTTATANTKATRTTSRTTAKPLQPSTSTVLSPKSHNSRTLPRSPFKATSPEKPLPARPINAAKPAVRAASRQQGATATAKRGQPARSGEERSSGVSDSSAGTTIVHKAAAATGTGARSRVAAAAKKGAAAVGRAAGGGGAKKGGAGVKKDNVAPSAGGTTVGGGRTLRKRG